MRIDKNIRARLARGLGLPLLLGITATARKRLVWVLDSGLPRAAWGLAMLLVGILGSYAPHVRAVTLCESSPNSSDCTSGIPKTPWDYVNWAKDASGQGNNQPGSYPRCPAPLTGGPPYYTLCASFAKASEAQIYNAAANTHFSCPPAVVNGPANYVTEANGISLGIPYRQRADYGFSWYAGTTCQPYSYGGISYRLRQVDCPAGFEQYGGYCRRARVNDRRGIGGTDFVGCGLNNGPTSVVGNPVSVQNGTKLEFATDYVGNGAFPLVFKRSYRSSGTMYPVGVAREGGAMGKVWRHNYEREVVVDGDTGNTAFVIRPNGLYAHFKRNGSNWTGDNDDPATLTELKDAGGVRIGWEFREIDDSTETFDAIGRLTRVNHRAGHVQTLGYDGNGRLATIADESGRAITLSYNMNGRVAQATFPDGQSIQYGYGDSGLSDGQVGGLHYDLADRLETVTFPGGAKRIYLYNEPGKTSAGSSKVTEQHWAMTGILDENGDRFGNYEWYANGRVKITEHAGGAGRYQLTYASWLGDGDTTVIDPLGTTKIYHHVTAAGAVRCEGVTVPCPSCGGTRTRTHTYDSNGYKDLTTDFRGITTNYDINVRGLETQRVEISNSTCPTGLTGCTNDRRTIQTDWHATLRVPTERRLRNAANTLEQVTRYAYNARGQQTAQCQVEPTNGAAMAYACGSAANAPTGVRQSTTDYCDTSDSDYGTSTCPRQGLVKTVDGPRTDVSDVTSYAYYAADHASCAAAPTSCPYRKGDLWKTTNAAGHVSEVLAYDGAGRVLSLLDANGVVTDFEYTSRGWLSRRLVRGTNSSSETDDAITTFAYEGYGAIRQVTQPDGSTLSYDYDAAHRLIAVSDGSGDRIDYTLDAAGNRTKEQTRDPSGNVKRLLARQYDALGRIRSQINAPFAGMPNLDDPAVRKTRFEFDANGNNELVTDALGTVTDRDYDALNRLIRSIGDASPGGIQADSRLKYDARGNLREVTDPKGLVTAYVYDGLGNLTQLSSPDTGVTTRTYDAAGNRKTQTDARGITATHGYDALNRLTAISFPNAGLNRTFHYDAAAASCLGDEQFARGRLSRFTDASGSTELCYDRRGNLVRKTVELTGISQELTWTHDQAGRVVSMTYPSGTVVSYGRDTRGRISQIDVTSSSGTSTTIVDNVTYLPFGPVAEIEWTGGTSTSRNYDQNYWIDQIDSSNGDGLVLEFDEDVLGNIRAVSTTLAPSSPDDSYGYDRLNRLVSMASTSESGFQSFSYDDTGNRTSVITTAGTTYYDYATGSHRLQSVGGSSRSYDANGNTTHDSTYPLSYDDTNRLATAHLGRSGTVNYVYNARGQRVQRVQAAFESVYTTRFTYDEAGHLLSETPHSKSDGKMTDIVWMDDLPVAAIIGGEIYYIHADHLGTPRKLVEPSKGSTVWEWPIVGNPFGTLAASDDVDGDGMPLTFNLRFPGQQYDPSTGLHYNYFRDYEAATGRYVESDPIGLQGGVSTFTYANSSPLDTTDPRGLEGIGCWTRPGGCIQPPSPPRSPTRECYWKVGYTFFTQTVSGSSNNRFIAEFSEPALIELAASVAFCCKPIERPCMTGTAEPYPEIPFFADDFSFSLYRLAGLSLGAGGETCSTLGTPSWPVNWSYDE